VSFNTVAKLLIDAGKVCAAFHDDTVRGVEARRVQVDEIWSFTRAVVGGMLVLYPKRSWRRGMSLTCQYVARGAAYEPNNKCHNQEKYAKAPIARRSVDVVSNSTNDEQHRHACA